MSELYNHDFESAVIGGLLIDPVLLCDIRSILSAEDFHDEPLSTVYAALCKFADDSIDADFMLVADQLEKTNPGVDWLVMLATIQRNTPSTANIETYAKRVAEYSTLRKLFRAGQEVCRLCHDGEMTVQEKISRAQSATLDLIKVRDKRGPRAAKETLSEWLDHLELCVERGGGITGLPSGFAELDELTCGFQPGELIVIGARPSHGKTVSALNIAQHNLNHGKTILIFSLEMQARELAGRMASNATSIFYNKIRSASLSDYDWQKITEYVARTRSLPLFVDDQAGLHINDIASRSRAIAAKQKIHAVVVDYLQLAKGDGETETIQIGRVSTGLKNLAKELDCPVIALSQLNREIEKRAEARPKPSDLRGSGQIEQDADVILFLQPHDELHTELIIGKARGSKKDSVWLEPRLEFMRFIPGQHFIAPIAEQRPFKRRSVDL